MRPFILIRFVAALACAGSFACVAVGIVPSARAQGDPVEAMRLEVTLDETTGRVDVDVAAPISEVLRTLGQRFSLNVMFEGGLEAPLTLRAGGLEPAAALRLVVAASGLVLEEVEGPIYLVRRPRDTDQVEIERSPAGGFSVPARFGYDVFPLGDAPGEQSMKDFLKGFERTKGVSLAVAPDLGQRIQREYIQERRVYQRLLEMRGLRGAGGLRPTIEEDDVRVYVSPEGGLYFCEVVFEASPGSAWHVVYVISAQGSRPILRLVLFTTPWEADPGG